MQRTIDPTHATTIIADSHGIHNTQPTTWRAVPPAEAARKPQAQQDDYQPSPENPEPKIPWMQWQRGTKLRVTREIPAETFLRIKTKLQEGTIVVLASAAKSHVSITTSDGHAYRIDGSNCCYLEWWTKPEVTK